MGTFLILFETGSKVDGAEKEPKKSEQQQWQPQPPR